MLLIINIFYLKRFFCGNSFQIHQTFWITSDMKAWQTPAPRLLGRNHTLISFPTKMFKPSLLGILKLEWPRPVELITLALPPSLELKPSLRLCGLVWTSLIGLLRDGIYSQHLFAGKMIVTTNQMMSSAPGTPQQGAIHNRTSIGDSTDLRTKVILNLKEDPDWVLAGKKYKGSHAETSSGP